MVELNCSRVFGLAVHFVSFQKRVSKRTFVYSVNQKAKKEALCLSASF